MNLAVETFVDIVNLACGQWSDRRDLGRARRLQLMAGAGLGAVILSALWGAAAGSASPGLAAGNMFSVPLVVILSSLCALPAGALARTITGAPVTTVDLLLAYASAVFGGTLVLAVSAPLIAVYYHTSAWAGAQLAMGSAFAALAVAMALFVRNLARFAERGGARWALVVTALVFFALYLLSLLQLVALASPILPEHTVFEHGIDGVLAP